MEQTYFDRVTRQTHVRKLLQKAVLNLCQKNYAEYASNLEVDGIICISFPDSPDQHVVKIHEKIQLGESRLNNTCNRYVNETYSQVQRSTDTVSLEKRQPVVNNEFSRVVEDRDSMQSSYLDKENVSLTCFNSSGNPVFPEMVPMVKVADSENSTFKSKRKMFKVVQRKKTTQEEPEVLSDSEGETVSPNTNDGSNKKSKLTDGSPCEKKTFDDRPSSSKKTNICESFEDGYVIVKVEENCDEENPENSDHLEDEKDCSSNKYNIDSETSRSRQWIQMPSHNEGDNLQTRESHITIDGKVIDGSYFSRNNEKDQFNNVGEYPVRQSVRHIDLSQSIDYSDSYGSNEFPIASTPRFPSSSRNHSLFKDRLPHGKGSKTLDNLYINKCTEENQSAMIKNKFSNLTDVSHQPVDKHVSMIDLQATSNNISSDIKLPDALSINLNRLINTHATKEKKYFCRHCGKGFTLKCTRSRHEKTICGGGGEGQYKCHICQKVFTRSDSRCRHLWKTHGVKSMNEVTSMC